MILLIVGGFLVLLLWSIVVLQLWKFTEVTPIHRNDERRNSSTGTSNLSSDLDSVTLPEYPTDESNPSVARRSTVTDIIGNFELGDTILHENPNTPQNDQSNFFQAEVTVQGHFSLDIATSEAASPHDIDILADIAILRLVNSIVDLNQETGVGQALGSGIFDVLEVLVSAAIDIPYIGPIIFDVYWSFLNSLNTERDREERAADGENNRDSEDVEADENEKEVIEQYVPTHDDIMLRIRFLDESSLDVLANPSQKLKVVKTLIEKEDFRDWKFVQHGKLLEDDKTLEELGLVQSTTKVIHCFKQTNKVQKSPTKVPTPSIFINRPYSRYENFVQSSRRTYEKVKKSLKYICFVQLTFLHRYRVLIAKTFAQSWACCIIYFYYSGQINNFIRFADNTPFSTLLSAISVFSLTVLHTFI